MDIVFLNPDPGNSSAGELMTSASKTLNAPLITAAANDDQLGDARAQQVPGLETTGSGWDAYEVWRRFIKDARDRRKELPSN